VIRLHEVAPADGAPIAHALKPELFAHHYYYGGGPQKRKLQVRLDGLCAANLVRRGPIALCCQSHVTA